MLCPNCLVPNFESGAHVVFFVVGDYQGCGHCEFFMHYYDWIDCGDLVRHWDSIKDEESKIVALEFYQNRGGDIGDLRNKRWSRSVDFKEVWG